MIDDALSLAHNLVRGLGAPEVSPETLGSALRELARWTTSTIEVECRVELGRDLAVPDAHCATQLLRIAQEGVTNALKHGQPSSITITLQPSERRLVLQVIDDGTGLRSGAPNGNGMGLRIMRYRAASLGGTVQIESGLGGGTQVVCTVPLGARELSGAQP